MRVAVMGSGSWGTAFAMVLADAGNEVVVWGRDAALAEAMTTQHENPKYQPGVVLPDSLRATTDPAEALDGHWPAIQRRAEAYARRPSIARSA